MLVCLSVLKCDSWIYEKFYSNKKYIGGGSSGSDPLVIITSSRVTATAAVVVFCIVLVLGYRLYRNWRGGLCKKAKVGIGELNIIQSILLSLMIERSMMCAW
jgi:hypothetical protein